MARPLLRAVRGRNLYGVVASACATLVLGCSSGGTTISEGLVNPTDVKCQPTVVGLPATVQAAGAQIVARVMTTAECAWSASADAAWLHVDPSIGQGEASLKVQVAANQTPTRRTAAIGLNGVVVQLTQAAAPLIVETPPNAEPSPTPSPSPALPAPPPAPTPTPPPAPAPTPAPSPTPTPTAVQFTGRISGLSGACPSLSFVANGNQVRTDENTSFTKGPCKWLDNGTEVDITGRGANGTVYATRVEFRKD